MISVCCPTRGRPGNMRRLVNSIRATDTAAGRHRRSRPLFPGTPPVEVVFYVDRDDPASEETASELGTVAVVGDRIVLSDMWNRCAEAAYGDVLMMCGDDIVFRTAGWDRAVLDAFDAVPDRIVLVHGDDRVHGPRLATHPFLHRRWVDAVGYMVPPGFSCDWSDVWLHDVAGALGRRVYLPDVITEHMHPTVGKGIFDRTHQERAARGDRDGVAALFRERAAEREADVEKLRAQMEVTRV